MATHKKPRSNLTRNEVSAAAWERAADILSEAVAGRVPARFREPLQEADINDHILMVVVPYLQGQARRVEHRRKK